MNVAMIIPTGAGCSIGGHAGDATPAARLLGAACDTLLLHPNVVNASDHNEMPANALYVDGWLLDEFFAGRVGLKRVRANRVLVLANELRPELVNAVNTARMTLGVDCQLEKLDTPLRMTGTYGPAGEATGTVDGVVALVLQANRIAKFDALAVASPIDVDEQVAIGYMRHGGVNPWGGVEAMASRMISERLRKPVAHAPQESGWGYTFNEQVGPRQAAEAISAAYINCVIKGLHTAPRMGGPFGVGELDALVTPYGLVGEPHIACVEAGVPVIVVKENRTVFNAKPLSDWIVVDNYLEAAGVLCAMRAGVSVRSTSANLNLSHRGE